MHLYMSFFFCNFAPKLTVRMYICAYIYTCEEIEKA